MEKLDRITVDPAVMGGKACIRGLRVTVGMIVGHVGAGRGINDLLADYPYLEREDILQALRYAAWREREAAINELAALGQDAIRHARETGTFSDEML